MAQAEISKSWRQARLMNEQANPDLPEDIQRRVPAATAQRFRENDIQQGEFYDGNGMLLPDPTARHP